MPNEPVVYTISSARIQENIFQDSHFAIFCEIVDVAIPIMGSVFPDSVFKQQNKAFAVKIESLLQAMESYFLKPGCICQPGFVVCSSVS
jgi:hypothetical protein